VIELSDLLPVLEHFGVRVIEEITIGESRRANADDPRSQTARQSEPRAATVRSACSKRRFLAVWRAHAESDGFNRLTLYGELPWRDVSVLRAVAKFLRQAAFPFSQALIEEALTRNPRVASALVRLFKARFDPTAEKRDEAEKQVTAEIDDALAKGAEPRRRPQPSAVFCIVRAQHR